MPICGITMSLSVAIPIEPRQPTIRIKTNCFFRAWILNIEAVTIALKTTWAGWKMEKSRELPVVVTFLKISINAMPRNAPKSVKGAWPFSSTMICLVLSFNSILLPRISCYQKNNGSKHFHQVLYLNATELQLFFKYNIGSKGRLAVAKEKSLQNLVQMSKLNRLFSGAVVKAD